MTAVDTNVLVRIITNDDKPQVARAVAFLQKQERVFLAKTVLLEVEWVLRSAYHFVPQEILVALRVLLATRNVEVENDDVVARALDWYGKGMDFADSLHLASSGERRFATFDVGLLRKAAQLGVRQVATV